MLLGPIWTDVHTPKLSCIQFSRNTPTPKSDSTQFRKGRPFWDTAQLWKWTGMYLIHPDKGGIMFHILVPSYFCQFWGGVLQNAPFLEVTSEGLFQNVICRYAGQYRGGISWNTILPRNCFWGCFGFWKHFWWDFKLRSLLWGKEHFRLLNPLLEVIPSFSGPFYEIHCP